MRILHLGKYYPPVSGGIETVLETLCRHERASVETRALVVTRAHRTSHETRAGVAVTRAASLVTVGAVSLAPSLPYWLARARADVLVLHEPNPMALVAYALARPRTPLVVWFHSEAIRPRWRYRLFYHPFLEFALRRAARIVVASPPMLAAAPLARHRAKCVVIPYGLDVARYEPSADATRRAGERRAAARMPILLFVGRLVRYKGVDVLLRALPGLGARAVLVGDGPLRGDLEALAAALGVRDRVEFAGVVSDEDLLGWYYAATALVLPSISRQEAFGMVQLEAMVCGRPVVSTDVPTGVPWVNQHEVTGLVARHGDPGSLRAALERLIADPELGRRLGAAGRDRVRARFTADRMAGAALAVYHEVAGRPRLDARGSVA